MNPTTQKRDLLALVADANMEAAVSGIVSRPRALGIRAISADFRRHPEKDSGCRVGGVEFLRPFIRQYSHALLLFDLEGCGDEEKGATNLEADLEKALVVSGWEGQGAAVVIEPELDIWVFGGSPHVSEELGWGQRTTELKIWLADKGFWPAGQTKPPRPKEAVEAALREVRKPRSSALYGSLAEKVSLERCEDRAFLKLKRILRIWFAQNP